MKRLPAAYSILILLGPLFIIAALMAGPFGCGSSSSPTATATLGAVEIGFAASPAAGTTPIPASGYQAVSFNIVSVRINPSTNPEVVDSDPNWAVITAPPSSSPVTGGELSVNLVNYQTNAEVFNIGKVAAEDYYQIEVVVDPTFPGSVTPACSSGSPPAFEGCVSYPLKFTGSTNIRTSGKISVTATGLTTQIINILPTGLTPPSSPGGNYTASPTISLVPANSFLGTVNGIIAGVPDVGANITAEFTGTNMVVATAPVTSSGTYTIALPGAETLGTTYDLYAEGTSSSTTIDVAAGVTVMRGGVSSPGFSLSTVGSGTIAGTITNLGPPTTKQPVANATVNVLLPSTTSINCVTTMGSGCVVVATTTSDSAGAYSFTIPLAANYYVQAQATGFTTVIEPVVFVDDVGECTGSLTSGTCGVPLPNNVIAGNVSVIPAPPAGTNSSVIVLAEQHGTGNLVGLVPVTVPATTAPQAFLMQLPTAIGSDTSPTFDLIATAQDTYYGIGSSFTGHNQAVLANVVGSSSSSPPSSGTLTVNCLGHGTVAGVALSPDSGTHVRLFQEDTTATPPALVQLQDTTSAQTNGQYAFCAPPNSSSAYYVQRFEQTSPTSSPSAVGTPQGPIVVATPGPAPSTSPSPGATPTPCPVCQVQTTSGAYCPGNCVASTASPL